MPFILFTRPHYELLHTLTFTRGCSLDERGHRRLTSFHIILENLGT